MPTLTLPYSGLRLGWGRIEAVETGAVIPLDRTFWAGLKAWLPYGLREFGRTMNVENIIEIEGVPHLPRPYYLLWGVLRRAGFRPGPNPRLSVLFSDTVRVSDDLTCRAPLVINGRCRDISKSRVASVFEDVFGYPLAIDPTTHHGPMVVKSEANGVHDGRIVQGPCAAEPGLVYQKLVDNRDGADGTVVDLRCPTVFGRLAIVCKKRRETTRRFDNHNHACDLAEPDEVFSQIERDRIAQFCTAMQLDWGGLDILRDRTDGRLYIVDVNKTDMPVLVLSTREKLLVSDRLAALLREEIERRL